MAKAKTKIQLILLVAVIIMTAFGHLVPTEYKVVFGFITGMGLGVYLFPKFLEAKLAEEIRLVWQGDDGEDVQCHRIKITISERKGL
jgi:hypothetical protein